MYRIMKTDGTELGITEEVRYIKLTKNGRFTSSTKADAVGVAYNSTPYNLVGHADIKDADTVVVCTVDGGSEVGNLLNTINILLGVAE